MGIPINISLSSASEDGTSFPPTIAQFGSEGLVLIELQGKLEVSGDSEDQTIGTLRVDNDTKKPTLLIGHHLLEGKLVNLPKPLAVLHRQSAPKSEEKNGGDSNTSSVGASVVKNDPSVSWDVIAVVKRKMVFSRRPMPIVGKASVGATELIGGTKFR